MDSEEEAGEEGLDSGEEGLGSGEVDQDSGGLDGAVGLDMVQASFFHVGYVASFHHRLRNQYMPEHLQCMS